MTRVACGQDRLGEDAARLANVPFLQGRRGWKGYRPVRYRFRGPPLGERVNALGNCIVRVLPGLFSLLGPRAQSVHEKFAPFCNTPKNGGVE